MNEEEAKKIIKGLATSPDFIQSLSAAINQVTGKSVNIQELGLFFFSQGYLSCMEYQESKGKLRPFKYEPPCK